METKEVTTQQQSKAITTKSLFEQANVKKKFEEMMGKRHTQFITSVLQIVASNDLLKNADPMSIFNAAAVAATLDLPLNNNLGFAYIVPYNDRKSGKTIAQFQMGYKGFIQLAQRSGQFKTISSAVIYDGQLVKQDPLQGFEFDFTKKSSDKVIGYAAYFALNNGFEKTFYMSLEDITKHATKFSQTFKKGFGLWKDDFDSMATKTVVKLLLSKYAPLSVEMQKAVITDQAIIKDENGDSVHYVDHEEIKTDKELERFQLMLEDCKSVEECKKLEPQANTPERLEMFEFKMQELTNGGK